MSSTGCKICDDKPAARAIDEELDRGLSYVGIGRLMTLRGWPVSVGVLSSHDHHRIRSGAHPDAKVSKRDLALLIRDKVYDRIETIDADPDSPVGIADWSSLAKTGLSAQGLIDKREAKKTVQNFWVQLYTETQGELLALDEGAIEGEISEIDDDDG